MSNPQQSRSRDRFRGKGMDPAALARAEEKLQGTGDAPLSPEWIEATVARATGNAASVRRLRVVKMASLAAALLLCLTLVASVTILWPEKQNSRETLEYPTAVQLLAHAAPAEREHMSSLKQVYNQVALAVRVLREIKDDPRVERSVAAAADKHLAAIRMAIEAQSPSLPDLSCDEVKDLAMQAQECSLDVNKCRAVMEQLTHSAITGILVMRSMPVATPNVTKSARILVQSLATQLRS